MNPRATLAGLLLLALTVLTPWQANADIMVAPERRKASRTTGLSYTVDLGALSNYGYHELEFKFKSAKASIADRKIDIRIYQAGYGSGDYYLVSQRQAYVLPASATSADFQMLLPHLSTWRRLRCEVYVDGVRDKDLCHHSNVSNYGQYWAPGSDFLRSDETSILREPTISFEDLAAGNTQASAQSDSNRHHYSVQNKYGKLSSNWKAYTTYDAVVLPLDELNDLADSSPQTLAALRRWVVAGGLLIVEHTDGFDVLPEINKTLAIGRDVFRPRKVVNREEPSPEDGQGADAPESSGRRIREQRESPNPESPNWRWARMWFPRNGSRPIDQSTGRPRRGRRFPTSRSWFAESSLGFGLVVAFPDGCCEIPSGAPTRPAAVALASYFSDRSWSSRHGLSPDEGNAEFSNWLIPGVGAAPVDAFRWLITLFVVLVGPVSYFFLKAHHRTYLLAATAPLAAGVFTVCLYGYATVSDGFSSRSRVRTLSLLDQTAGEAVTWSRQTYYCGLAPGGGMIYPRTAAVYPLLPGWKESFMASRRDGMRDITIQGDTQRLSGGWLRSRETTQLLVVDAKPETKKRIALKGTAEQLSAINHLGPALSELYVRDTDGGWWKAENLAPAATAKLKKVEEKDVTMSVRSLMLDNEPRFPPGLDSGGSGGGSRIMRYGRRAYRPGASLDLSDIGYGATPFGASRMEILLGKVSGADTGDTAPLAKGCYLAVSGQAALAPTGIEGASEEQSLHVTIGRWAR